MNSPLDVVRLQAHGIRATSAALLEQTDVLLTEHDVPALRALRLMLLSLSEQCGAIVTMAEGLSMRPAPPPRPTVQRFPTFDGTPAVIPVTEPAGMPAPVPNAEGDILPNRPNGGNDVREH